LPVYVQQTAIIYPHWKPTWEEEIRKNTRNLLYSNAGSKSGNHVSVSVDHPQTRPIHMFPRDTTATTKTQKAQLKKVKHTRQQTPRYIGIMFFF
jgi:hypothetical protein